MNEFTAPLRHPQGILCWLCVLIVCRGRCRGQIHWNGVSCKYKTIGDVRLHNWMRKKEKNQRINMYLHLKKKLENEKQIVLELCRITADNGKVCWECCQFANHTHVCGFKNACYHTCWEPLLVLWYTIDVYPPRVCCRHLLYDALYGNTRCIQIHLNDGRWK